MVQRLLRTPHPRALAVQFFPQFPKSRQFVSNAITLLYEPAPVLRPRSEMTLESAERAVRRIDGIRTLKDRQRRTEKYRSMQHPSASVFRVRLNRRCKRTGQALHTRARATHVSCGCLMRVAGLARAGGGD